jgi:hypothetical protein
MMLNVTEEAEPFVECTEGTDVGMEIPHYLAAGTGRSGILHVHEDGT